ncbi:MAG: hypothetical protein KGI32_08305 [Gammaproteobacteria bacterium]|nr:hypothetical protein [Gammaproteobacteria bacterium]
MHGFSTLLVASVLLAASPCLLASPPPNATTTAPAPGTGSHAQAQPGEKPAAVELGKVNVTAMRRMIETLQQVKIALKRPFDHDPKHVDNMVCRLYPGVVNVKPILECGNQGWFARRRDQTQGALAGGWRNAGDAGMQQALDANSSATNSPSSEYGHQWHTVRAINRRQIIYFRQILNALPAPGKGEVIVVDAKGKTMITVKAMAPSGPGGDD